MDPQSMLRVQVYRRILPSPSNRSITDNKDFLLLPESLGGFFFGISFVVFYLTARNLHSKVSSTLRKVLALTGLSIWFLLAVLFHVQGAAKLRLFSTASSPQDGACMGAYVSADLEYRQGLSRVASVLLLVSAWLCGVLLLWRAFTLLDRRRWVLYTFGICLFGVIVSEIVFLAISPETEDYAWPVSLIANLVFSGLIGVFVTYCHIARSKGHKRHPFSVFVDILIDSGMLLTVTLVVALALGMTGFSTEGLPEATSFFCQCVLFHVQNITACLLISRMLDLARPEADSDTVKLVGDNTDSLNERDVKSALA